MKNFDDNLTKLMKLKQLNDNLMKLGGWEAVCSVCHGRVADSIAVLVDHEGLFHIKTSGTCGSIVWRHTKTGKIFE